MYENWSVIPTLSSADVEKPDELLQMAIYSHGVAAFRTSGEKNEAVERLENLEAIDGEICCSWKTQKLGSVGAYVTGNVTLASNSDIASFIEDGERKFKFDECYDESLISSKAELDLDYDYNTEFWLKDVKIVGIWVDTNQWKGSTLPLKRLAKKMNVKLFAFKGEKE